MALINSAASESILASPDPKNVTDVHQNFNDIFQKYILTNFQVNN